MKPATDPRVCGLCGSRDLAPLYRKIRILDEDPSAAASFRDLRSCGECHSYWSVLPPGIGTTEYYVSKPAADHDLLDSGGTARFRKVRRRVERVLGRTRYTLLDVGSGGGAHLTVYGDAVERHAVEPSDTARPMLATRGVTWLGRFLEDVPGHRRFDVVTCLDVLEHIEHPAPFLASLAARVAPGGVLALVTGNIDSFSARFAGRRWAYYALPEHCAFFSSASLRRHLAEGHGFVPAGKFRIANQDIDLRYVRAFARGVVREAVVKALPQGRRHVLERDGRARFPFFVDNMLLLFRRPGPGP